MNRGTKSTVLAAVAALGFCGFANATDLEVTHWWTSGGEAAALKELADAFNSTGNRWVDGAIAGSAGTARPIMISRITGGDPMGATQFNHGRQAEELIEAGLMRDLTDVAEKGNWREVVRPSRLLDACTVDGKIYCVPINIHSWQWLWLSREAFETAGVAVPQNWDEFVAAAPALEKAGIVPLAMGAQPWQISGAFDVILASVGGPETFLKVYQDKDAEFAAGPEIARVFKAADDARKMARNTNVQDWNQATNMVITAKAGGQIMGDWAQGEFQVAGKVAGKDYSCLPGLGTSPVIATAGDALYFPLLKDEAQAKAQEVLAETALLATTQVAFSLKKGSLPVRSDVDLDATNECMRKGLDILDKGNFIPWTDQLLLQDTQKQKEDLLSEFFASDSMSVEEAQKRFVGIIATAE